MGAPGPAPDGELLYPVDYLVIDAAAADRVGGCKVFRFRELVSKKPCASQVRQRRVMESFQLQSTLEGVDGLIDISGSHQGRPEIGQCPCAVRVAFDVSPRAGDKLVCEVRCGPS